MKYSTQKTELGILKVLWFNPDENLGAAGGVRGRRGDARWRMGCIVLRSWLLAILLLLPSKIMSSRDVSRVSAACYVLGAGAMLRLRGGASSSGMYVLEPEEEHKREAGLHDTIRMLSELSKDLRILTRIVPLVCCSSPQCPSGQRCHILSPF